MKTKMTIGTYKEILFVCLFDEFGHMLECHPFNEKAESLVGNIYNGIVKNKIKGIGGYFVDFGSGPNGFLPISKSSNRLSPGQTVTVQVEKDAYGTKGAKLTARYSLTGEYAVLVTDSTDIHFSSKLPEDQRTKSIKSVFKGYGSAAFGFIVRTNAYDANNIKIQEDIEKLIETHESIENTRHYRPAKALLHKGGDVNGWMKMVQNVNKSQLDSIETDSTEVLETANQYLRECSLHNNITVNIVGDLYHRLDLNKFLTKVRSRKAWLPSGGFIIIDRTEAMYVIDVNSGKNNANRNSQRNILKINLEACSVIARQIRARNLSGIIIIDFIDMPAEDDRLKVIETLRSCVADDPIRTLVHGMTALGLVEVTRKRLTPSLEEQLKKVLDT